MAPSVFDGKARFAHAAQSMDRLASGETNRSPLAGRESLPELGKRCVATFKERAEGVVRKINHSARCLRTAGWKPQFPDSASGFCNSYLKWVQEWFPISCPSAKALPQFRDAQRRWDLS